MVLIKLEWKHIREGERGDCHTCPVSLAMIEVGFEEVTSGQRTITVRDTGTGELVEYETPPEVARFIINFDSFSKVSPFQFTLDKITAIRYPN